MRNIQIFELSQDGSGAVADEAAADFAADVAWAKEQGAHIERFSFAEQPDEFARNAVVEDFVERSGYDALPLALVDGELAVAGRHPTRNELARWAGLAQPVAAGGCCSGGHCG
jgi:hypothetical protein